MPKGYLLLVLHAHLPYVRHPEHERFLEERWFYEAVSETYIPLIKFLDMLREEQVPFKLTLSISPTLANMMEDPLLRDRCVQHLDMMIALAERECQRTQEWEELNALSHMYRRLFADTRHIFVERCGTRLTQAFKEHADSGHLELITCTATHGHLPLLATEPTAVRAQVQTGIEEHQRIFGQPPRGMWIPECSFYPGLDALLAEAGIRYFIVDSHGIDHADPKPLFGVSAPIFCPSGVAAFGRHPMTSKLVWSTSVGYPADFNYREYYRDIGYDLDQGYLEACQYAPGVRSPTGIKYNRITGKTDNKHLYNPDWAAETARHHAWDFLDRCRAEAIRSRSGMPSPSVILSPYDAELFGHWWFEGPQWLYHVLRAVAQDTELGLSTPGEYLSRFPVHQKAMPAPSSWGYKGYHEYWVNERTQWMWKPLHEAATRTHQVVQRFLGEPVGTEKDRTLRQAARELLLAQSSDWPFMITKGDTEQYGRRRFQDHLHRLHDLLNTLDTGIIDEEKLRSLEAMDAVFPELNYRIFAA